MKKLLCLALLVSAGSIYSGSISANNKPTDNKSGNNSKDIYKKTWIDFNKNGIKDVYEDPSAPIEARIADLLSQMTLEEKTCQMATLYGSGRVLKDAWPTTGWSTEIWKDGIGNIDEQANGLGKFGSEISYPYANSVKNRQPFNAGLWNRHDWVFRWTLPMKEYADYVTTGLPCFPLNAGKVPRGTKN